MNFSQIQLNVASESAIMGIQKHVPKISLFAKSFTGRPGQPYNGVAIPLFANLSGVSTYDPNSAEDKYCEGETLQGAVIPLNKLTVKSYTLTDYEVGSTDNLYLADGARAMAEQAVLDIANKIFTGTDALGSSEITATTSTPSTKAGFAGLFGAAANAGANPYDCVVALNATTFSTLLGTLDSYVYGGPEAIRDGVVPGLYGFRGVVVAPSLPEGVNGFIIPWESIGVASRWNKAAVDGYDAQWTATDPKTGFTVGFRVFEHLCSGTAKMAADVLWGVKLIQPSKIVKITA
jgi:hypothetical protein